MDSLWHVTHMLPGGCRRRSRTCPETLTQTLVLTSRACRTFLIVFISWVCPHCLLCRLSGWCHVHTEYIIRRFHAIDQKETWAKAQSYCRDRFNDLATILDQTHNADAQQAAGNGRFWIGLYHTSWKWSQDDKDAQLDNSFTSWASDEAGDGKCVTISALGIWSVSDCAARSFFTCYSGEFK